MCVNAIRTILQFTLVTHGHLFRVELGATKGTNIPIITHNILIIIVLLCRCGPYMCRYVFTRTIWRVPYLSSNQKLLQMQEYTHVLMQLRTGSPPYVPYDAPVPHACKQVLNTCPIETMNIIVLLKVPNPNSNPFSGVPNKGGQNQKSKCTLGVTMMPLVSKHGFKDCPGFLNSTGRLGPKRGRKCYVTPAFSGIPKQRGTKSEVKTSASGHHDAPRGPLYLKVWVSSTATRPNGCTACALRLRFPQNIILSPKSRQKMDLHGPPEKETAKFHSSKNCINYSYY